MNSSRRKLCYNFVSVISVLLLAHNISCTPQRSSYVQSRYIRPSTPIRDNYKCSTLCSGSADRGRSDSGYKTERDRDYDVKVGRDDVDDYKPKDGRDEYEPKDDYKPKEGHDEYEPEGDYKPNPPIATSYNVKPIVRDDYEPKPNDEYKPKPTRVNYNSKPDSKDEYEPKPAVIDENYKPKPPVRFDYNPKPSVRDDYNPKPSVRDDYNPKPSVRDDYNPKPSVRDDYNPKPSVRDDYNPKPSVRDDYNPKPSVRDDYNPSATDDYKPKPPLHSDYDSKPIKSDDYDDYEPKPAVVDNYKPKPRPDYNTRPISEDKFETKPIFDDEYKPKPPNRDNYNFKPNEEHAPKPPVRDSYRPPSVGGHYSGYPVKKDDDYKVPSEGFDNSKDNDYNDYKSDDDKVDEVVEDDNCICVPYYQCKDGHIVTDGAGIIDARRRRYPEEELPLDGKFKPPSCGPFHVCCDTPESSTVKPYEHRCGVRNPSGINSRILSPSNKGEADFGEWPWQAAVLKSEGTVNIFQCGGVLIDKYHVLTVAHCVFHLYKYHDYPLKVRLGEWDTQTTNEFLAHEDYKVSKISIHPEYKNTSLWNDIAILRLQDPVLFAPHIDTVCLPKYDEVFSGQNCVVTGWGKDSYKGGTFSNVMKEVALHVIDNYSCEEMLRKTRLGRFFQLHEGFVCAGGEHGLDSCKGDGGGPLVCYRKDRSYALAGLVSWGIDCGQPGVPGVYVKMQKYLEWISKNTEVPIQDYWPKH